VGAPQAAHAAITGEHLDRSGQVVEPDALGDRIGELVRFGGHLGPGAAVEHCDLRSLAPGGPGGVESGVAAADHCHPPSCFLGEAQVDGAQVLDPGDYAGGILARDLQRQSFVRANAEEHRLEAEARAVAQEIVEGEVQSSAPTTS
jgi:hypothetical protein